MDLPVVWRVVEHGFPLILPGPASAGREASGLIHQFME